MKKLLAIGGVVATIIAFVATSTSVILTSCGGGEDTSSLNLQYEVVNNGTDVKLTWTQIESADYYTISVDGTVIDSTADNTVTEYTVTSDHAGKVLKVTAVGAETSDEIDIAALVKSTQLSDFGEASSSYKSAVGFGSDGSATVYSLLDSGNYSYFDFWISDGTAGNVLVNEIDICSPNVTYGGTGNFNSEDNWSTAWGTGYVAPTGGYQNIYPGSGGIMGGGSYAIWLDPSGNGWDLNDHFVKFDVSGIGSDGAVSGTVYYQTVGGLLWIPVD
ncbi:MAG: hypothetical protein ABIM46_07820 [candidate division WOR-3 bacterium]